MIEVIQLTWDQHAPHFRRVARYECSPATHQPEPDHLTLDGSFVVQRFDEVLLVWDWRRDHHAWISCKAVKGITWVRYLRCFAL